MSEALKQIAILIVDDQKADRMSSRFECEKIFERFSDSRLILEEAASIEEALEKTSEQTFQLILLDKDLGEDRQGGRISGIDYIAAFKELQPQAQIFMLTGDESYKDIVTALKHGASDYLLKSDSGEKSEYRSEMLRRALTRANEEIEKALTRLPQAKAGIYGEFVCKSPAMRRLDQKLKAIAEGSRPVLLLGATGLGKGAVARRLNHFRSEFLKQGSRPFVNVNIGAMPDALAQSELFGQDAYSFTGSGSKMKPGLLDFAKGGDIFLDEVGDTSPEMQLKLLKVIEERQYLRVGGRQPVQTNARFIFATNKNVQELVQQGKFREDLYMRMQAFEIEIPSLEERKEDLPAIIEVALKNILGDAKHKKLRLSEFPDDLMRYLTRDNIPGNIRGIENDLLRLVSFLPFDEKGYAIMREWKSVLGGGANQRRSKSKISLGDFLSADTELLGQDFPGYKEAQNLFTRKLIEEALVQAGGYQEVAASRLKISKATMSQKVKALNIKVPRRVKHEARTS